MSQPAWTDPQRRAIEDEGGALLVSAAAGSGKTAVLVERAVRLITREEAPVDAQRLLILTFTNAAAEELRSRIARRLEEALRAQPQNTALRRQKMQLGRAFIGTIDAFCQQLVRENFIRLALPPDIAVGDAALLERLSAEVMAGVMEEMYADDDFAAFAALHGQARSDRAAEEAVLSLYHHTMTLPFPQRQLGRFAAMYNGAPLAETPWAKELLARAAQALAECQSLAIANLELVLENPSLAGYAGAVQADLDGLAPLCMLANAGDWDSLAAALRAHSFARLGACRGEEELRAAVQTRRDMLKKTVADLAGGVITCTAAEYEADCAAAGPMVAALCRAAGLYADEYYRAKLEEKVLDFGDFEHLALGLLQGEDGERTPLAGKISARYDAVMVDEYQDTNELQDALYRCLAAPGGDNLFFVGDAKQSIYRFRQANPGIFLAKKELYAQTPPGGHPVEIDLGHNFRSSRAVIDGVNYLFGALMSADLGEMAYGEGERLIPGGAAADAPGGFAVHMLDGGDAASEAAWVARRIAHMVREGAPVADGEGQRPAQYGDFCILMRARKNMPLFVRALEDEGIPVAADLADSLLDTPEVLCLASALAAVDNPGDDVALAATLLGPLFRFSPDALAALRAGDRRGRLWAALVASSDKKCVEFVEDIRYYRALSTAVPVGRLCEALAGDTGYLSAVAAMEGGEARRENLLRFMGWAGAVGAGLKGGLAAFVRLLEAGKGPTPPAAKTLKGHVSLLTIHKSKGLEFPFVFLCDAAHQFQLTGYGRRVQVHTALGVGLVLRNGDTLYPSLQAQAIRSRAQREELSEEMRLLYVALTRARQGVTVSFATKDAQKLLARLAALADGGVPGAFALSGQRSMAHWVLLALLCHQDGVRLLQEAGVPVPFMKQRGAEGHFDICLEAPQAAPQQERKAFALTAAPDPQLVQTLTESFAQTPPLRALAQVPAKLSVSALAQKGADEVRKRPSFMYASGLSAAERGTAQHTFLQFCDFDLAAADPSAEVRRLQTQGYMAEPMAKAIDIAGVRAFFASPLMARVRAADRVLREYDFITSVPAGLVQPDLAEGLANEPVLVQGIADMVLVKDGIAEIIDYKTDAGASAETLAARYGTQLRLYRRALEKRLELPVAKLTIWSFALAREIDVPRRDA